MTINLMNTYIDITKKQINEYLKMTIGKEYKKQYVDRFVDKYINIRYYNFYKWRKYKCRQGHSTG